LFPDANPYTLDHGAAGIPDRARDVSTGQLRE
jgi:hypothetical protein